MKKIPTLFERDWDGDRSRVLPGPPKVDVAEATPTRKRDGTACLIRGGKLYKRYDAKPGRTPPPAFELVEADEMTGHAVGWVPVGDSPEDKWHREGCPRPSDLGNWTYELCGPKIQGNPEGVATHRLFRHGDDLLEDLTDFSYDALREYLTINQIEGIVWWKDGQPVAKIKRRDFGLTWPTGKGKP